MQLQISSAIITPYLGHLGSIRVTVKAGDTLITDGFDATLSQWTTVKGCCFTASGSALSNNSSPGTESILVNSSSTTTDDGLVSSTVSYAEPPSIGAPCLVFRYQDLSNFSYVSPGASSLAVIERISGTDYTRGSVSLPMASGTGYRFEVNFRGSTVTVKRDGAVVLTSSSLTRLSAGKVGVRVTRSYTGSSYWNDFTCMKTGADQIASYDDFYPYGQVIEGRSFNAGLADARFKYTEKERDVETGYDYFGARYYDSRIGRWMSVDPLAEKYRAMSPFVYSLDNPMSLIDVDGRVVAKPTNGNVLFAMREAYRKSPTYRGLHNTIRDRKDQVWKVNAGSVDARAETSTWYGEISKVTTTKVSNKEGDTFYPTVKTADAAGVLANEATHTNEQAQFKSQEQLNAAMDPNKVPNENPEVKSMGDGKVCTVEAQSNQAKVEKEMWDSTIEPLDLNDEELDKLMFADPNDLNKEEDHKQQE